MLLIYPYVAAELFLSYDEDQLEDVVANIITSRLPGREGMIVVS